MLRLEPIIFLKLLFLGLQTKKLTSPEDVPLVNGQP